MVLFEQPATIPILPSLIVLVHCLISRKDFSTTVETVLKCAAGFYLVCIGGAVTGAVFSPINHLTMASYGISAGVLNTESFSALLLSSCGNASIVVFIISFLVNLCIAKATGKSFMFLTCHHLLFLSLLTFSLFRENTSLKLSAVVALSGILTGIYAWITTLVSSFSMRLVRPGHPAALSNSANAAGLIALLIGKVVPSHSNERFGKEGSSQVSVFLVGSVTVFILYTLLYIMTGCFTAERVSFALTQSILFGASSSILMLGIRMFLSPLIALLWDLTHRLLPTAIAGLDATAMIAYSPRAWNTGFITASLAGTLISVVCLLLRVSFVPLPGITSLYFAGGVAGVTGNASAGKKGAAISGFITGIVVMLLCSSFMSSAGLHITSGTAPGETGYSILGWITLLLCRIINALS